VRPVNVSRSEAYKVYAKYICSSLHPKVHGGRTRAGLSKKDWSVKNQKICKNNRRKIEYHLPRKPEFTLLNDPGHPLTGVAVPFDPGRPLTGVAVPFSSTSSGPVGTFKVSFMGFA